MPLADRVQRVAADGGARGYRAAVVGDGGVPGQGDAACVAMLGGEQAALEGAGDGRITKELIDLAAVPADEMTEIGDEDISSDGGGSAGGDRGEGGGSRGRGSHRRSRSRSRRPAVAAAAATDAAAAADGVMAAAVGAAEVAAAAAAVAEAAAAVGAAVGGVADLTLRRHISWVCRSRRRRRRYGHSHGRLRVAYMCWVYAARWG